jgi:hypothetical protein
MIPISSTTILEARVSSFQFGKATVQSITSFNRKRIIISTTVLEQYHVHKQKVNLGLTRFININPKWIIDQNVICKL